MSKEVYNRIKSVLVEQQVTSRALAEGIGKSEKIVSRWCTNSAQPSIETLFLIAKYLKVQPGELLAPLKGK